MDERIAVKAEKLSGVPEKLTVNWSYPNVDEEQKQVQSLALILGGEDGYRDQVSKINEAIHEGAVKTLDEMTWSKLKNTESFDIKFGELERAQNLAKEVGKDASKILETMRGHMPLQMPIILIKRDGEPYLVSGNTRLMLARALGDTPQVLIGHMK